MIGARLQRAVVPLSFAVPCILYLRTMAPTVSGGDSAELATGAAVLGIVHSPGSPLYLLVAHLFTWLPIGDVAYRVNLFSVIAASGACALVGAVLLRLGAMPGQAIGGAWLLASLYYFWINAIVAELYAVHALVVALLIYLVLCWRQSEQIVYLYAFALTFGAGLGVHLTLVFLAPGFLWMILGHLQRFPSAREIGVATVFGGLGSSVFLYLPIRAAAAPAFDFARLSGIDLTTLEGFWWMVSGRRFAGHMFGVPAGRLLGEIGTLAHQLGASFVGLGALLAFVGVAAGLRGRGPVRALQIGLALAVLGHLGFVVPYAVLDKQLMLAPLLVVWTIWTAIGAGLAARWLSNKLGAALPAAALLLSMALFNTAVNFPLLDISQDRTARQHGSAILEAMPPDAVYVGNWVDVPIVTYLQVVEGVRTDVAAHNVFFSSYDEAWRLIDDGLVSGRPVFSSVPALLTQATMTEPVEGCECIRILRTRTSG